MVTFRSGLVTFRSGLVTFRSGLVTFRSGLVTFRSILPNNTNAFKRPKILQILKIIKIQQQLQTTLNKNWYSVVVENLFYSKKLKQIHIHTRLKVLL